LGEDEYEVSEVEASECIEEMANIVSGRSVSVINDVLKEKELRITPPGTIMGNDMSIVNPKLTSFNIVAQTKIGSVTMNVGFAGGE
jgi:CheY-specific phosphatase CheX